MSKTKSNASATEREKKIHDKQHNFRCEEDTYQTDYLAGVLKQLELSNCHLEKIARQSCHSLNELHL